MNAPSADMATHLAAQSALGLTIGTDLHAGDIPDSPDECVAVKDTGGFDPEPHEYLKPTIQVRVRGAKGDGRGVYALAKSIFDELHLTTNLTISGTRYILIWAQGDIMDVGKDDNKRPLRTVNFRLHRTSA